MVRIYCLTSIFPWNEKLRDKLEIGNCGIHSFFDENTMAFFEKIKKDPEVFKPDQLTEINMGYEFIGSSTKKRFFMCFYRKDTGWIRIRMLPGIMQFHVISNLVSKFLIASSKFYPNDIKFDIEIRVRCIRNTTTKGGITKDEEKCYEDYLKRIKNESTFNEIPFSLPNETHQRSLKQKISDMSNFVKMVCDPKNKNKIIIPEKARFVQEIKCFRPQIKRGNEVTRSQYYGFVHQNKSRKEQTEVLSSKIDTSINASKSSNVCFTNSELLIPHFSKEGSAENSSSRKRGRPLLYENEIERKIAKTQNSKEYNERLKSQREDLKTEIMDIESKQQDLYFHVQNLRSKFASVSLKNEDNDILHQLLQQWKELFKKSNKNLKKFQVGAPSNNDNVIEEVEPQNSSASKNSAATNEFQIVSDKPQKLTTRREKQKIAIRRFRQRQKMENQILQEKKNLLLFSIQELTKITKLIEELLSILRSSSGNFQTNNGTIVSENILSTPSTSTTLDRSVVAAATKNIYKVKTNYERIIDSNSDIPICIETYAFTNLVELTLQNCGITELSNFEMLPTTLSSLNLSNNEITSISEYISQMTNLKELNLASNKRLKEIPWEYLPSNLLRLNIKDTGISFISSQIEKLNQLETFELGNENLENISWKNISKTLQKISITKAAKNLNSIDLMDKSDLTFILLENVNLEEKDSTNLMFKNLYVNMEKSFQSLQYLYLIKNGISTISWHTLPSFLKVLKIEENEIDEIGHISHLDGLIRLVANCNSIKSISDTICKLQTLTIIQLENNLITSLPNGFENLSNLKYLNLKNNRLNYESGNLEKSLWKRLPLNLQILKLDGNILHKIPCFLKKLKFECLSVNECKLVHICPFFITEGRKNGLILEIRNNSKLQKLPIIPSTIFQPNNNKKYETSNIVPLADINLITDNPSFVNTSRFPTVQFKPIYKFEYCEEDDSEGCKCCGGCGDLTDEKVFEQLMMMDINLCLAFNPDYYSSSYFLLQKSFDDENLMEYLHEHETEEQKSSKKDRFYGPGTWKTMVKSRLCPDCFDNLKVKINTAFRDYEILNAEIKRKESAERMNNEPALMMQPHFTPLTFEDVMSPYQHDEWDINVYQPPFQHIESGNHLWQYPNPEDQMHSKSIPPNHDFNYFHHEVNPNRNNAYPQYLNPNQGMPSSTIGSIAATPESNGLKEIKNETSEFDPFPSGNYLQNPEQHNFIHSSNQSDFTDL